MIAAGRSKRPGASWPHLEAATQEELDSCPFCAGREDRTPPETLTIGEPWRHFVRDALETVMLIKQAKDKGLNLGAAIEAARRFRADNARFS